MPVRLGDAAVRPGDVIVADVNGVVVVPAERLTEVLEVAERILAQENAMMDALRAGHPSSRWIAASSTSAC